MGGNFAVCENLCNFVFGNKNNMNMIEKGTKIQHKDFGNGTVVEVNGKIATVGFDEWGEMPVEACQCSPIPTKSQLVDIFTSSLLHHIDEEQEKVNTQPQSGVEEVDLHFEALIQKKLCLATDNQLDKQLEVFHKTMQSNAKKKGKHLIFIHGKGNGRLREYIVDLLKKQWTSCEWLPGNSEKYGLKGAIEIIIK